MKTARTIRKTSGSVNKYPAIPRLLSGFLLILLAVACASDRDRCDGEPGRAAAITALSLPLVGGCGEVFPRYTTATRRPPAGFLDANRLPAERESVRRVTFV